ncbi:HlyD family secretion protein [Klebsiella grimontii]|uniref:HlyD family secretion protein n=1 Tax=Klebsiella grimontii TaxID=2058152 RepID=UPI000D7E4E73|nr:HlyD family secretion protein [Klebsiella grimontii]AWT17477.1 HlyD family secretion protein [Klebsiella michiganensis]MBE8893623.1 HlyD family secretion protein [Klebsiella grimontii]QLT90528.1 HlyD family secretion protein [Klebsiella grimontii]QQQ22308.1 HlyD family secretion protein [Klebsiella grimontii]
MKKNSIFRREAIEYKRYYWKGKVLLLHGVSAWIISALSSSFLLVIILSAIFFNYTQRIDVRGEVITLPNSINVFAPQQGFIVKQFVAPGDIVKKGDPLYELDISRYISTGSVSNVMINMINDKILNAEEIIKKTEKNREETLDALNKQVQQYTSSLNETSRMLVNTNNGLQKMKSNLTSYDEYLKKGLITKDQYNYQHSLYFQQQSAYQSLTSQKMQLESQLTQLKSDIVTKAADFDNQISGQKNQINDYKNQLVESSASGNLVVSSTSDGKIESISVTTGQMVDKGSSLAQIKPAGNVKYYLVLWLPNNSLPYVKVGDIINIRYDAFPSDKFGQFPGVIETISSIPASRQEMSEYTNVNDGTQQQELALYKTLVAIKDESFSYKGKTLRLSNGLKAHAIVFLEERPLYMWMFSPFYKISQSLNGPINEQ